MTSYVKKRNCCFLQKSKKYFESITQNVNETLDIVKEFTIKGEYCELKYGDFQRLYTMRNSIRKVIVGWAKHTQEKLNSEVIIYTGYCGVDSCNADVDSNGLRFTVRLYIVGENLEARAVPMFTLSDKVGHAFALGDFDSFYAEYESNPDILVEDISEFLLSINKLEKFISTLSQPNICDLDKDVVGYKVPNYGPTKSMVALPYSNYVEKKYCKPHEIQYHYKHPQYYRDYTCTDSRYTDTYTDTYTERPRRSHRRRRRRRHHHDRYTDEDSYYDSSIYHEKHKHYGSEIIHSKKKSDKKHKEKNNHD